MMKSIKFLFVFSILVYWNEAQAQLKLKTPDLEKKAKEKLEKAKDKKEDDVKDKGEDHKNTKQIEGKQNVDKQNDVIVPKENTLKDEEAAMYKCRDLKQAKNCIF